MRIVCYKRLTFKILGAAHETSCDLLNRLHSGKLVALLPSNKKVLGSTPGQEYFCMEFACLNQFQYSVFLGTHNFQLKDLLDIGSSVPATNSKMKMDFLCQQYSSLCSLEIPLKATYQNVHEASEEKYKVTKKE
ncbi:hypothetical protein AMECASPLE_014835 [Ameca splendens]|uniref:Uncharacterized protein n=1 Tax=Ameca splendens TaxID=208324 RepID=A0ABV1A820_9TELE